jgi:F0F1-type ATP synthase epsilon subunit
LVLRIFEDKGDVDVELIGAQNGIIDVLEEVVTVLFKSEEREEEMEDETKV